MRIIERPVGMITPFVGLGRLAIGAVLVEVYQEGVFQYSEVCGRDFGEVGADEEGRFHGGPEGEVRAGLCQCEAVADFEDVGVVVGVEVDAVEEEGVLGEDFGDAFPIC